MTVLAAARLVGEHGIPARVGGRLPCSAERIRRPATTENPALLHRSCDPLDIQRLSFPGELWFVLVNPVFEAPTAEMRAVLPREVPMAHAIRNCAMGGSLVRACRSCCFQDRHPQTGTPLCCADLACKEFGVTSPA